MLKEDSKSQVFKIKVLTSCIVLSCLVSFCVPFILTVRKYECLIVHGTGYRRFWISTAFRRSKLKNNAISFGWKMVGKWTILPIIDEGPSWGFAYN